MPTVERKGKTPKYLELPDDLVRRVQAFGDGRGEPFVAVVVQALERHLAYPPATVPPLPAGKRKAHR